MAWSFDLLKRLNEGGVEYLIIGGVAIRELEAIREMLRKNTAGDAGSTP